MKIKNKLNSWYKTAQIEPWYNKETADITKDPEIFRKILEKGNNDNVSWNAAINLNCPPETLKMVLERERNDDVSYFAANNPNCPPETLKMILERGKNDDVSYGAASNLNCPPEALKMVLERGKDDYVSYDASKNPNCPLEAKIRWMEAIGKIEKFDPNNPNHRLPKQKPDKDLEDFRKLVSNSNWYKISQIEPWHNEEIAKTTKDPEILRKILEKENNDFVSFNAVSNPNCPPELLKMVLEREKNDFVSHRAARNPNCPPEALKMVLERGKDDSVSHFAVKNLNCPLEAKIRWMELTGRIEKFDPNNPNHKLPKQKPDKDLEDFRKLVSNNKNWYKISQAEDWYNEETAKTTKDPEILRKILVKDRDDWVSFYAARNPNCPPEALKMVLERDQDNNVSVYAARNPNCPPEALKMVLERGKDDNISWHAARNPNCPPEALKMVLERGKDDLVSRNAAQNKNCPPELLKMILERGKNDYVSCYAAKNPNCSPEVLKMILEKGKNDDVSMNAVSNPNCPPEAKIRWMEEVGKIEKYNPNNPNHRLPKQKYDKDLEDFRKLVSNNKNWYKISNYLYDESWEINPSNYSLEKNILNLHELEYKFSYLQQNTSLLSRNGLNTVINKINTFAYPIFEYCKDEINKAYDNWLNRHPTENPEKWAKMVLETYDLESEGVSDETLKDFLKDGITWGSVFVTAQEIMQYINKDYLRMLIHEDFYGNPEAYEYQIEKFLNINKNKIRKKFNVVFDSNEMSCSEFMYKYELEDDIFKFILDNYDEYSMKELVENLPDIEKVKAIDFERAIKEILYERYIDHWGGLIEEIKYNIEVARKRLDIIDQNSAVQEMTIAISLAINVIHAGGNITGDYFGLDVDFLNNLDKSDEVINWKNEIEDEFGSSDSESYTSSSFNLKKYIKTAKKEKKLYVAIYNDNQGKIERIENTYVWAVSPQHAIQTIIKRKNSINSTKEEKDASDRVNALNSLDRGMVYCIEVKERDKIKYTGNDEIVPDEEFWGKSEEENDLMPITKHHVQNWNKK